MGNGVIAGMFAVGVGAWAGNKFYKRTGGNTQKSLVAGAIAGGFAFVLFLTLLQIINK